MKKAFVAIENFSSGESDDEEKKNQSLLAIEESGDEVTLALVEM